MSNPESGLVPQSCDLEGFHYQYYDVGVGNITVLFFHGVTCDKDWSMSVIRHLPQGYRYIAIDLPGHCGISFEGIDSLEGVARYVERLVKHLKLKNVVLAGYSLGGIVAYETETLFRGAPWLKGVIVWASPLIKKKGLTRQAKLVATGTKVPPRVQVVVKSGRLVRAMSRVLRVPVNNSLAERVQMFPTKYRRKFAELIVNAEYDAHPAVPSLFVYDPIDPLVSSSNIAYLQKEANTNCKIAIVPGGGHSDVPSAVQETYTHMGTFLGTLEKVT